MIISLLQRKLTGLVDFLKYTPPTEPQPFILEESSSENAKKTPPHPTPQQNILQGKSEFERLIKYAYELTTYMDKVITALQKDLSTNQISLLVQELAILQRKHDTHSPIIAAYDHHLPAMSKSTYPVLEDNKSVIEELYQMPTNKDLIIRNFTISATPSLEAMLVYLDGMIDKTTINLAILQPLMLLKDNNNFTDPEIISQIAADSLPSCQVTTVTTFSDVVEGINSGDSALFINGYSSTIIIETKGFAFRGVQRPQIEQSIRGSQAGFSETLRINTTQIRLLLPSPDLVTEFVMIGKRIPMRCAVMYLRSIANPLLVAELKRRLQNISVDHILNTGILDQFIDEYPGIPLPQSFATERPDRAAANLTEGRIAYILDGTPFVHIVPITLPAFFQTIDDYSLPTSAANFMRLLRILGTLMTMILPASYLAISYFHQEALPTELALAIAGAREQVPFPALVEILLMEFSFELIREAGVRVPGVLGSTIGIVGAIILGQAAVSANIVSPIMVVIISITGLASFTIPDYRFSFALRIMRFIFLLLSSLLGLVGIAFVFLLMTEGLSSLKSLGVPFLAPSAPRTATASGVWLRGNLFEQERRPDELNPLDNNAQAKISRGWTKQNPEKKEKNK